MANTFSENKQQQLAHRRDCDRNTHWEPNFLYGPQNGQGKRIICFLRQSSTQNVSNYKMHLSHESQRNVRVQKSKQMIAIKVRIGLPFPVRRNGDIFFEQIITRYDNEKLLLLLLAAVAPNNTRKWLTIDEMWTNSAWWARSTEHGSISAADTGDRN